MTDHLDQCRPARCDSCGAEAVGPSGVCSECGAGQHACSTCRHYDEPYRQCLATLPVRRVNGIDMRVGCSLKEER